MPVKIFIAGFITCAVLLYSQGFSQSFNDQYSPIRNFRASPVTMKAISASYAEEIRKNIAENKKVREMINESLNHIKEYVIELDSFKLAMYSDSMTGYLKKMVDHIAERSPGIIKDTFYVFIRRTDEPNASNIGKGILLVNLGLINRFHSEAEIAFVLCHEISHQVLNHVLQGIKSRAELFYNKDFQKELKKAQRQEYSSMKSTEALAIKYLSHTTEYSREKEYQADSLGLILFYNAGYSPASAISAMNLLDSVDMPLYAAPINFRNYFEFAQCPFRNEWLTIDPTLGALGGNLDSLYTRPDSLKTHPDCPLRAKALERISKKQNMNYNNNFLLSPNYSYYQETSCFERVEFFLNENFFGEALYDALQLQARYPDNLFLKCAVANCLCEIYRAQINHTFSRVVNFPDIHYSKSYNEFLSFLHNLSGSQLKNITVHYGTENVINLKKEDSYCRYIDYFIKGMDKSKTEYAALVADYQKDNILDAHYKTLLDEKFKINLKKK
jgi:Zn-dependent protease with chaperone function